MLRKIINITILTLIISIFATSCRTDFDFETASSADFRFSKETVYLDTVFKNIGSSTYTLKVYNNTNKDIKIPSIQLKKGLTSKYRMIVDGMQGNAGKIFSNVELLAKDSLYIFLVSSYEAEN